MRLIRYTLRIFPLLGVLVMAACGGSAATAPTAVPTIAATAAPTVPTAPTKAEGVTYKGIAQTVTANGYYSIGNPAAKIVLDDYSDYLCPTCNQYVINTEPDVIKKYVATGQVYLRFFPILNFGESSVRTSEAAACAAKQGQGWQMHDLLYENQRAIAGTGADQLPALMKTYAAKLAGLDQARFATCIDSRETLKVIQASDAEQRTRGITYQPIFEVNGVRFAGAQPIAVFDGYIAAALTPTATAAK